MQRSTLSMCWVDALVNLEIAIVVFRPEQGFAERCLTVGYGPFAQDNRREVAVRFIELNRNKAGNASAMCTRIHCVDIAGGQTDAIDLPGFTAGVSLCRA